MTTATRTAVARKGEGTIADKVSAATAVITIRMRKPGARGKVRDGSVAVKSVSDAEGDPDQDSTTVSAELLRAPEYHAIATHDRATRGLLVGESLPAGRRLAPGSFMVPMSRVEGIYAQLDKRSEGRAELVEAFVARYPSIVQDALLRLRDAFDVRKFPGASVDGKIVTVSEGGLELIRSAFSIDYELEVADREAGVRAAAGTLSKAFVEKELAKARDAGAELAEEIRMGLRVAFSDLVQKATAMLLPQVEGERRNFRPESLEKVLAFLDTFKERDVTGDVSLASIVDKAKDALKGVDPEALREARGKTPREQLGKAMAEVSKLLVPIVTDRKRKVQLGGDL